MRVKEETGICPHKKWECGKTTRPDYGLDYGRLSAYSGGIFHEYQIACAFASVPAFFVYE